MYQKWIRDLICAAFFLGNPNPGSERPQRKLEKSSFAPRWGGGVGGGLPLLSVGGHYVHDHARFSVHIGAKE